MKMSKWRVSAILAANGNYAYCGLRNGHVEHIFLKKNVAKRWAKRSRHCTVERIRLDPVNDFLEIMNKYYGWW